MQSTSISLPKAASILISTLTYFLLTCSCKQQTHMSNTSTINFQFRDSGDGDPIFPQLTITIWESATDSTETLAADFQTETQTKNYDLTNNQDSKFNKFTGYVPVKEISVTEASYNNGVVQITLPQGNYYHFQFKLIPQRQTQGIRYNFAYYTVFSNTEASLTTHTVQFDAFRAGY